MSFLRVPREDEQIYDEYRRLYQTLGFKFMTENVLLRRPLLEGGTENIRIPSEFELKPLTETNNDDLYPCYFTTFSTGEDRFFFNQTDVEKRAFFDETFNRREPINENTSLILMKNDQIVGFSLVRPTHGQGNAHLWMLGIHPEYRRRGIGKALCQLILQRSAEWENATMSLVVERSNVPAYSLYTSLGFKEEFTKIEYSRKIQ